MESYLTVKDVALLLQLSVQTIRRYTMNKEIPFHKMNRAVRYKKSEIEFWFERRGTTKGKAKAENLESGLFGEAASDETGEKT
jgi:excisionase family DNA binding protein